MQLDPACATRPPSVQLDPEPVQLDSQPVQLYTTTYTLRMWLCMKWHGAWLYGVHRTRRDGSSFMWHQPCQRCKYTTSVDIQKTCYKKLFTHVPLDPQPVALDPTACATRPTACATEAVGSSCTGGLGSSCRGGFWSSCTGGFGLVAQAVGSSCTGGWASCTGGWV